MTDYALTLLKTEKGDQLGRERERGILQSQRRALQYATKSYSPSKEAKEWGNIPLFYEILFLYFFSFILNLKSILRIFINCFVSYLFKKAKLI